MKLSHYITFIVLIFSFINQSFSGGAYNRFGIGERRIFLSGKSASMGGVGISLRSINHLNRVNPASWSDITTSVNFSASLRYEGINTSDGINSSFLGSGNPEGAILALPILPSRGVTASLGFGPMSNVSYNIERVNIINGGSQTTTFTGNGGITNLFIGSSYRIDKNLSLGAILLLRTGLLQYGWQTNYDLPGFSGGETDRTLSINGVAGTVGILYSGIIPPRQGSEHGPLSIGVVVTTPSVLNVDEDFTVSYATGIDTTMNRTGTITLPILVGIGIGYNINHRTLIGLDFRYEPWEDFRKFGIIDENLKNAVRFGIGFERTGGTEQDLGFFERTTFRLGIMYNASYYNIEGTPINEMFITGGIGFPLSRIANMDVGIQIGVRGTTDMNLQRDHIFRLIFAVNSLERWFVRTPRN